MRSVLFRDNENIFVGSVWKDRSRSPISHSTCQSQFPVHPLTRRRQFSKRLLIMITKLFRALVVGENPPIDLLNTKGSRNHLFHDVLIKGRSNIKNVIRGIRYYHPSQSKSVLHSLPDSWAQNYRTLQRNLLASSLRQCRNLRNQICRATRPRKQSPDTSRRDGIIWL